MNKKELSLGKKLLFLLIPPHCAACNEAGYERLCPVCREELRETFAPRRVLCPGGNGFADEVIALFPYEGEALKSLLYQWKWRDLPVLGEIFLPYLARRRLASLLPRYIDRVTFVPRRRSDRRMYAMDQAECLARLFAELRGLFFEPLLKRQGRPRPQKKLSAAKRRTNVAGTFVPLRAMEGETVLLIDDIVTTGSSVSECARVLKRAGDQRVVVLCLAH